MSKSVSFILPIYNTEESILIEGLEKLHNLVEESCEFLLIDDGSDGYIKEICNNYVKKDDRFIYFFQENKGVSVARNVGMEKAQKEWLFFLDPDDYIDFFNLDYLSNIDGNVDLLLLGYSTVKQNKRINTYEIDSLIESNEQSSLKMIYSILKWDYNENSGYYLGTPWAKMFRRKFLTENGLFYREGIIKRQDALFMINVFRKEPVFKTVEKSIYNYRLDHVNSVNNKYNPEIAGTYLKLVEELSQNNHFSNNEYSNYLAYYAASLIIDLFEKDYLNKNNNSSIKIKKEKFHFFIEDKVIKEVLLDLRLNDSRTFFRKIKFWGIKRKKFYLLYVLSKLSLLKNII